MFVDTKEAGKVSSEPYKAAKNKLALNILKDMRALLADESRHCRFHLAMDKKDKPVFVNHLDATKFCLIGAADYIEWKTTHKMTHYYMIALDHLAKTIELHPEIGQNPVLKKELRLRYLPVSPVNVNNLAPHSVTMMMLDLTIARLENA